MCGLDVQAGVTDGRDAHGLPSRGSGAARSAYAPRRAVPQGDGPLPSAQPEGASSLVTCSAARTTPQLPRPRSHPTLTTLPPPRARVGRRRSARTPRLRGARTIAPPKDRREAKARMKAEKGKERQQTMEALRGGDERRYPARDQGKGRHLARNWVDGRRNIGEFFWPIVIAALVLLFLPIPALQQGSTVVLLGFYVLITVDTGLSLLGLRRALCSVRYPSRPTAEVPSPTPSAARSSPASAGCRCPRSSAAGRVSTPRARSKPSLPRDAAGPRQRRTARSRMRRSPGPRRRTRASRRPASRPPGQHCGLPTMAPETPGQAIVHAAAAAAVVTPCRSATLAMAVATVRLASRCSVKSSSLLRQSSSGKDATRSAENAPVSRPACIGEYTITPVSCSRHQGSRSAPARRSIAENGGCRVSTWPSCLGTLELGGVEVAEPDCAVEPLGLHVEQRLPVHLELDAVLGLPVHLHEVDRVGAETPQRCDHLLAQNLGVSGRRSAHRCGRRVRPARTS